MSNDRIFRGDIKEDFQKIVIQIRQRGNSQSKYHMKKPIKITLFILLVIVAIVFTNGCYFVFKGQFIATDKVQSGKDLNLYEIASTYTMHTACWLFGWVFAPTTAHLAFCSQFGIIPENCSLHTLRNSKLNKIQEYLLKNKIINKPYRITFDSYTDDVSMYLNGTTITLINYASQDFGNSEPFIRGEFRIDAYYDYKPGIITFKNIKISETLFDYLENKNILHPFKYTDTWTTEQGFNYKNA